MRVKPLERYNAGQAFNHPWITRKLHDTIPMTFDENKKIFESKENLLKLMKTVFFINFLRLQRVTR
jgi:calcium/calmodulin-dependent protein kinase I